MQKTFTVATEIQKVLLEQVLFQEMERGFWKGVRPEDHFDSWRGVQVVIGMNLGASGFEVPRNYNFANPEFLTKMSNRLVEAAQSVNKNVTLKQVKRQLISLSQITGGRLKDLGGEITKLRRGRKTQPESSVTEKKLSSNVVIRKAVANIVETETI